MSEEHTYVQFTDEKVGLQIMLTQARAENARLRAALEKVLRTLPNGAWRDKLAPTIERALSSTSATEAT